MYESLGAVISFEILLNVQKKQPCMEKEKSGEKKQSNNDKLSIVHVFLSLYIRVCWGFGQLQHLKNCSIT